MTKSCRMTGRTTAIAKMSLYDSRWVRPMTSRRVMAPRLTAAALPDIETPSVRQPYVHVRPLQARATASGARAMAVLGP